MTYHSTVDYYKDINDAIATALGGYSSAPLLLSSLDFQMVRELQIAEDWDAAGALLLRHAQALRTAGAEALVICTNLMHKVAPAVEAGVDIPLLHIVDAVAAAAKDAGLASLGIMGTGRTMTDPFYANRLTADGIRPVRATPEDAAIVDRVVFEELTKGVVTDDARAELLAVVDHLAQAGADGVVLGCTELPLSLQQQHTSVPLIDSTKAHVKVAVEFILS